MPFSCEKDVPRFDNMCVRERAGSRSDRLFIQVSRFSAGWSQARGRHPGAQPTGGVPPDMLRWPATHCGAAGGSRGDQEVFATDGGVVAGTTLRPWMMRLPWM
jgi:hypothetical protein